MFVHLCRHDLAALPRLDCGGAPGTTPYSPIEAGRWLMDTGFVIPRVFMMQPRFVSLAIARRE